MPKYVCILDDVEILKCLGTAQSGFAYPNGIRAHAVRRIRGVRLMLKWFIACD